MNKGISACSEVSQLARAVGSRSPYSDPFRNYKSQARYVLIVPHHIIVRLYRRVLYCAAAAEVFIWTVPHHIKFRLYGRELRSSRNYIGHVPQQIVPSLKTWIVRRRKFIRTQNLGVIKHVSKDISEVRKIKCLVRHYLYGGERNLWKRQLVCVNRGVCESQELTGYVSW